MFFLFGDHQSTLTFARYAISCESFFTFAVVGSTGIYTFSIWITIVFSQTTLINVLKKGTCRNLITEISRPQTSNEAQYKMSQGLRIFYLLGT